MRKRISILVFLLLLSALVPAQDIIRIRRDDVPPCDPDTTFPCSPLRSTFGVNSGPPPDGFTGIWRSGSGGLKALAGECLTDTDVYSTAHWPTSFGTDSEVYATLIAVGVTGASFQLPLGLVEEGTTGLDGYVLHAETTGNTLAIYRYDNDVATLLGASVAHTPTAGDSYGLRRRTGGTLEAWHKPAAGSWTLTITRTDSTYTAAGKIGLGSGGSSVKWDNFGGGSIPAPAPTATRQIYYAESDSEQTRTSSTYLAKASLVFTPDANETYYIISSWQQNTSVGSHYAQARLRRTSGTAATLQDSAFSAVVGADYSAFGGLAIETFGASPAAQTYETQYASSDNATTISTKNHRIAAIRKETGDENAESLGETNNSTTDFVDKVSLTFTPASTGDYLILAACDIRWGAGDYPAIQLLVDATVHGLAQPDSPASANQHSWAVAPVVNLTAASHTIKIQFKRHAGSAVNVTALNARIIALRLDSLFPAYHTDSDISLVTYGTDTNFQDRSVVTQTLAAEDYLVISSQGLRFSNQAEAAGHAKLLEASTDKVLGRYHSRQPFNESIFSIFTVYKKTFTAASFTFKTQYTTTTATKVVGNRDSHIAVIQLTEP